MMSNVEQTTFANLNDTLRKKATDKLWFVARALLGYDKLTPHFHYEMCSIAQQAERYKRVLILVPRDHYKSTICTISYPVWRGLKDSGDTGLIIANTATNARKFVSKIRDSFEKQQLLRNLFPELKPELSNRWNKDEVCLPRDRDHGEATWEAAGWDTKVTSRHYDYIVMDDLVDEETYESPELMQKLNDRFEQREGLLRPPIPERVIMVVMNHWSNIDIACHIIKNHPEYFVYYRQAIEGGKPLFPEAYPLEWLLSKQQADPITFARQWLNNPMDASVTENKLTEQHYYQRDGEYLLVSHGDVEERVPIRTLNLYAGVDLRHTLADTHAKKLTSRNAYVVGGIDCYGRPYILEAYAKQNKPDEFVNDLYSLWQRWSPWGLIEIGVEGYGYQAALEPLANAIWRSKPLQPRIKALRKDSTTNKEARNRAGFRFFTTQQGYTHRSCSAWNEEYISFPGGRFRDVGDAWYWCTTMMTKPEDDDDVSVQEAFDEERRRAFVSKARI